jgi:enterobacterial common antigen flippase
MESSYRTIFKSSVFIGGAQIASLLIGIVRTKAFALMLGPSGMSMVGLYGTASSLVGTLCSLGISNSGVRLIAEAAAVSDDEKISATISTVRRATLVLGAVGMAIMLVLSKPLGQLTFGNSEHTFGMALMSLALLFGGISSGQSALLQGMRKIRAIASSQVIGSISGAIASIALIYVLREDGVAPYLVTVAAFSAFFSWWFARRLGIKQTRVTWRASFQQAKTFLGMGVAFMVAALLAAGLDFGSRVIILRELGSEAVGLYQATWTLSFLYVNIVLNAMAMDFFPRLTAVARDNTLVNKMVNEQTEMGLLISIPGVMATITLAPWILTLFYSKEFVAAAEIIRWQIMGIALRVISWPLSFVQLAKGKSWIFIASEMVISALHITLLLICMRLFGLSGLGISFTLLYVCYTIGMLFTCHYLSGFSWSTAARRRLFLSSASVVATFFAAKYLPQPHSLIVGLVFTIIISCVFLLRIQQVMDVSIFQLIKNKLIFR